MNKKILTKLGQRIKELRKEQNMTQEVLAEKINVHQTYIGKLETGKSNPSFLLIYKISKKMGISLGDFFNF